MSDKKNRSDSSTQVTNVSDGKIVVRDHPIDELIASNSYAASIFLMFQGKLPNANEEALTNAVLVSLIDHGIDTPSVHSTRAAHRGGNSLNVSVCAGILAFGEQHGGSIEKAAHVFQEAANRPGSPKGVAAEIVGLYAGRLDEVPGYGHKVHKTDPRTTALLNKAKDLNFYGRHCEIAEAVAVSLVSRYKRSYPLNVGGAVAAVMSELGFDWRLGPAFFLLGRSAGLITHAFEEIRREAPLENLRELPWNEIPDKEKK
jgi:citryl-CoA lyase